MSNQTVMRVARQRLRRTGCQSAGVQPYRRRCGGGAALVAMARESDTSWSRMAPSVWRQRHQPPLDHHSGALYVRIRLYIVAQALVSPTLIN